MMSLLKGKEVQYVCDDLLTNVLDLLTNVLVFSVPIIPGEKVFFGGTAD